jgi:hypothetical protein
MGLSVAGGNSQAENQRLLTEGNYDKMRGRRKVNYMTDMMASSRASRPYLPYPAMAALFLATVALVGCDTGPPRRSVWVVSWEKVRHWEEFAGIVARPADVDEVVFISLEHESRLREGDAKEVIGHLTGDSTEPILDLESRTHLGKLELKFGGAKLAEIQCYSGQVFSYKDAYFRSKYDVVGKFRSGR